MMLVLAATTDPAFYVPTGLGLMSAIAAVLATARYIKRVEDDTVTHLRETAEDLEERCRRCEEETKGLRVETRLLHRQVWWLSRVIEQSGVEMPDGFPTV